MITVIGVRFKTSGRIYYFDPAGFEIGKDDGVIVETARGVEFADIAELPHEVEDDMVVQPLKPVLRVATAEDRQKRSENSAKEADAFAIGEKKIKAHGLDMKLVSVEYAFDGSKVVFYFTADERVDFRELVRDLASQFRTRIELRQIGVRDEAKMLGGLGPCGRPVCCKSFLDDFRPVSIKMAKEQNLSLSPTKISGLCGRLMCCLQYEQGAYEDAKKRMPKVGKEMLGPDGIGIVIENNAITEKTKLRMFMEDGTIEVREYPYSVLVKPGETPQNAGTVNTEEESTDSQSGLNQETQQAQKQERTQSQRKQRPERPEFKRKKEPKKTLEEHVAEIEASQETEKESAGQNETKRNRRRHRSAKNRKNEENPASGDTPVEENNTDNEKKGMDSETPKKRHRPRRRRSGNARRSDAQSSSEGGKIESGAAEN